MRVTLEPQKGERERERERDPERREREREREMDQWYGRGRRCTEKRVGWGGVGWGLVHLLLPSLQASAAQCCCSCRSRGALGDVWRSGIATEVGC